jgi:phosphatidylglycerol lysyltransferase
MKYNNNEYLTRIISLLVALNALALILGTLISSHVIRHGVRLNNLTISLTLIEGIILLYFARFLSRRKLAAWYVVIIIYFFLIVHHVIEALLSHHQHINLLLTIEDFFLPIFVLIGLLLTKKYYLVKSDMQSFASSLRFIILIFIITIAYGIAGYMLMDTRDFHQEIGFFSAFTHTIDQFGLLTNNLTPYSSRARLFVDSLSVISISAVTLAIVSLFKPIKAKLIDQHNNRLIMHELLVNYPSTSEDFFKIWPHDKDYFINKEQNAAIAYKPHNRSALIVGDPAGDEREFESMLKQFEEVCYVNDWSPVLVHIENKFRDLYESIGFEMQKLGEEAIVNLSHFNSSVRSNKYFRNIEKRFTNAGYTYEVLKAPHSPEIISRLRSISNDWLKAPGRTERGLVMGYFSNSYMQQCNIIVAKDDQGRIMGFINQVPSYDVTEANYDLLRHSHGSLGNINDFLLLSFISECTKQNYKTLNLGLCPLSGMDRSSNEEQKTLDRLMNFTYSNGDRLYSFSGLKRFKAKYEPTWSPRYLGYKGGIIGFTKGINALNSSWKVRLKAR